MGAIEDILASRFYAHRLGGRETRRGFSLAEVFLVVVIMSILSAIAVPRIANFLAGQRLAAASRRIVTDLGFAQRRAKTTGVVQKVKVETGTRTLELEGLTDPDHPGQPYVLKLADEPYTLSSIAADFGGGVQEVAFDAYGMPDVSGTITMTVGEYQRIINVDSDTGRATAGAMTLVP